MFDDKLPYLRRETQEPFPWKEVTRVRQSEPWKPRYTGLGAYPWPFQSLPQNRFSWAFSLEFCPGFFQNLRSISVNFRAVDVDDDDDELSGGDGFLLETTRQENRLSQLLEAAPQLQSLTLHAKSHLRDQPRKTNNLYGHDSKQRQKSCDRRSLTKVTLIGFYRVLAECKDDFWEWELFNHAQVVNVSVHIDLSYSIFHNSSALSSYIDCLKDVSTKRPFRIQCSDTTEALPHRTIHKELGV